MSSVLAPLSVNAQNEPTPRKQKSDSLDGHKRHFLSLVAATRLGGVLDQMLVHLLEVEMQKKISLSAKKDADFAEGMRLLEQSKTHDDGIIRAVTNFNLAHGFMFGNDDKKAAVRAVQDELRAVKTEMYEQGREITSKDQTIGDLTASKILVEEELTAKVNTLLTKEAEIQFLQEENDAITETMNALHTRQADIARRRVAAAASTQ
eukprot:CAMPEP_0181228164 /NCGR_PEP_ID=MMETSP1096-20121128/33201_1 /TAXON_ID=156174 ORGANISM="Chrysochromulina ericina, Strain CCMP281" /NCGR_SAMPLE_ID=MMETSP1096 /ASSEMBLY_ACC=CAM_ASM_000453 /LENGTH=205 /DNA_ID=CAMNT_0023321669 /DNA_START=41 /DNA_END=658 /DNA_ORIENTATION=-